MIATSHDEHMRTYQQADLILDPFPHGGGVVSLEQLYMGVPLITRYGTQPAGRSAASVLTTMGLTEWIAKDAADYVEKAVATANDWKRLSAERKTLQQRFLDSPAVKGYVEAVEAAYRKMWTTWLAK
jgi:predicted O-linked N-acetylglucosamine transferase (SPINDLY family)